MAAMDYVQSEHTRKLSIEGRQSILGCIPRHPKTWLARKKKIHQKQMKDGEGHPFPCARKIVMTNYFELLMGLVIIVNCGTIGWEAETDSDTDLEIIGVCEIGFTFVFFVEFIFRFMCNNWTLIADPANFADMILVLLSAFSIVIKYMGLTGFTFIKKILVLRTLRLMRLGRAVKQYEIFQDMWQLLKGIQDSVETLFWTYVMIFVVCFFFAILATELIGGEPNEVAQEHFGTMAKSMTTLFQIMTLDSWTGIVRPIAKDGRPWVYFFFVFFISIGTFVLMNLIVAVIVENAFDTGNVEQAEQAQKAAEKRDRELQELKEMFKMLDKDQSGDLDKKELLSASKDRKVIQKLQALDLMPKDLIAAWDILDDGDGKLSVNEFVDGFRKLKGEAKAKDIIRLQKEQLVLRTSVDDLDATLQEAKDKLLQIREQIGQTSADVEAFRRTMNRAKAAVRLASRTQRLCAND